MPEPLDVPFGGLQGLVNPNRVPFGAAITATDCFLDDDTVTGRTGYRSLLNTFVAATGTPQFIGRFQPTLSVAAHTVAVISGNVWLLTEASSETASDATATEIGVNTFGATDNISGDQLAENFYLATDNSTPKWVRITPSLTLEVIAQLPTPAVPSATGASLDLVLFNGLSAPALSGITVSSTSVPNWEQLSGTAGSTAKYDLTTGGGPAGGYQWQNTVWLMMTLSPETLSGGGTNFQVSLQDTGGTSYPLGTIVDPPNTNGSPWCVFFYLVGLDISDPIKYITFTQGTKPSGSGAAPFCISGFMAFSTAPEPGTVDYYVVYYNSVTGAVSALSPALPIVYAPISIAFPATEAGRWNYNNFQSLGIRSTNPDTMGFSDMFNRGDGLAYPTAADFAFIYTFSDTIPAAAQYPNTDTIQLYRSTSNTVSLVGNCITSTRADGSAWTTGTGTASDYPLNYTFQTGGNTAWDITDNTGQSASSNPVYQPGGPGPSVSCLCAFADRLVGGYANTLYISSFTPITAASDLIPQWPAIAIQDSNGWSFNIDPAPTEQILSVVAGDALYIGTNKRVSLLRELTPGTIPFDVLNRGVIGKQAAVYAEEQLMWAAYDGVYFAQNVSNTGELTQPIRIYVYKNQFLPDSTVAIGYQERKLSVFRGNKRLRYDFVTSKWTGPDTLADSVFSALSFSVTQGTYNSVAYQSTEQLWVLTADRYVSRFQSFCQTDNAIGSTPGTSPPAWVYSTGFSRMIKPGFATQLSVLASGLVTVKVAKTLEAIEPDEARLLVANDQSWRTEVDFPGPTDLRGKKLRLEFGGANLVSLFAANMMFEETDAAGG